jgi:hypothetical protein
LFGVAAAEKANLKFPTSMKKPIAAVSFRSGESILVNICYHAGDFLHIAATTSPIKMSTTSPEIIHLTASVYGML